MSDLYVGTIEPNKRNEFYITLPRYGSTWSYKESFFMKIYPDSMI